MSDETVDRPTTDRQAPDASVPGTGALQRLLVALAALGLLAMVLLVVLNRRLEQAGGSGRRPNLSSARNIDRTLDYLIWPAMILLGIVMLVLLARWTWRSRRYLERMGATGFDFPVEIAAASWLIPGVNLVLPKLVIDDSFRSARRAGAGIDGDPKVNRWVNLWWIVLIASVAVLAASALVDRSTVSGAVNANSWTAIGVSLLVLSSLCGAVALASVDAELARLAGDDADGDSVLAGLVDAGEPDRELAP